MPEQAQIAPNIAKVDGVGQEKPEFVDFHGLRRLFGIPRSTAYELLAEGEIRAVSLRRRGKVKARRLVDCDSVRAFMARSMVSDVRVSEGRVDIKHSIEVTASRPVGFRKGWEKFEK